MKLSIERAITQLERSAAAIEALCRDPGLEPHWKPSPEEWSTVEVLGHLADEEREDFRPRLDITLHHPDRPWPPLDPEGRVKKLDFASRDPQAALDDFLEERERSIEWLRTLDEPDWSISRTHPRGFELHAGDFFTSWVAHDLLHLRQITRLQFGWIAATAEPYSTLYAGEWEPSAD